MRDVVNFKVFGDSAYLLPALEALAASEQRSMSNYLSKVMLEHVLETEGRPGTEDPLLD